jgi:hypothetical protein
MTNSNAHPQGGANDPGTDGYRPSNRVDPLPRQWQQRLRQPAPARAFVHETLYPASAGAWQPKPARRTEFSALLGLWLLVVLAAVAIALRFLDLSSVSAGPRPLERGAVGAEPTEPPARMTPYLIRSVAESDDPFDDPAPASTTIATPAMPAAPVPPRAAAAEIAASAPMLTRAPATGETLSAQAPSPVALPVAAARPSAAATPSSACPEALRAMQLCAEQH